MSSRKLHAAEPVAIGREIDQATGTCFFSLISVAQARLDVAVDLLARHALVREQPGRKITDIRDGARSPTNGSARTSCLKSSFFGVSCR